MTAFGHGKHTCPAQPFSLAAMSMAVTHLLGAFELTPGWSTYPAPVPAQIGGVARGLIAVPRRLPAPAPDLDSRPCRSPRVVVDGLVMRYGDTTAVDGLSLTVDRGTDHRGARPQRCRQDHHAGDLRGLPRARSRARSGCWAWTRSASAATCSPASA